MKIRYLYTYPFAMDLGGGGKVIKDITSKLKEKYFCEFLDYESKEIDFDILIVFGCTYLNPHMLNFYRNKGVRVVLYPIFDRMKPLWQMKLFKFMLSFPILNIYKLRKEIFGASDLLIAANESEKRDLIEIYDTPADKIRLLHYGISDNILELDKTIGKELFQEKYPGWTDFVFCPAAVISQRKNQMTLIKALKGSGVKLVLNNTNRIVDNLEEEFDELTQNDPDILRLESLDLPMLISCYKNAKVSVSVSQAETAGLVNLEAGYLGCNLVVSDLEALREYLAEHAIFVNQNDVNSVKLAVLKAVKQDYNPDLREFVQINYTWDGYIERLENIISEINKPE